MMLFFSGLWCSQQKLPPRQQRLGIIVIALSLGLGMLAPATATDRPALGSKESESPKDCVPGTPRCPSRELVPPPDCTPGTARCPSRGDEEVPFYAADVPYIVSPRRTGLLEAQPALRWHDTGSGPYQVRLERNGEKIWETLAPKAEIPAGQIPPLVAGASYRLVVTAANGKSSNDDLAPGLNFELLTPPEAAAVRAKLAALGQAPGADRALAEAQVYFEANLNQPGIARLEQAIATGIDRFDLRWTLGDRYGRVLGLAQPAGENCQRAIALAPVDLDPALAAEVRWCAALAAEGQSQVAEAIRWMTEAESWFERAGQGDRVRRVQARRRQLETLSPP